MLVNYHAPKHVYIVCGNTDLRKEIDTLAILIADNFGLDLYDNSLFLFCGRRNDRFKALYWDGEGFILLYKRFDNGRLTWPRTSEEVKELDSRQLDLLLKGLNPLPQPKVHQAKKAHFIKNYSLLEALPTDMLLSISLKGGGELWIKIKL